MLNPNRSNNVENQHNTEGKPAECKQHDAAMALKLEKRVGASSASLRETAQKQEQATDA